MAEKNEGYGLETFKRNFTEKLNAVKKFVKDLTSNPGDETAGQVTHESPNIAFYRNEIPCYPLEDKIENILETWKGNHSKLEANHLYIQWLFPNRKPGINPYARVLTDTEVEVISNTPELRKRVRGAFEMMLDFYGMRLTKDNQFELGENSKERLRKLNQGYNHNYLRITRILLALKELGHRELMLPWMKFIADLVYKEKVLNHAASSFEKFWMDTLNVQDSISLKEHLEQLKIIEPTSTSKADSIQGTTSSTTLLATPNITHGSKVEDIMPTT